MDEESLEISPFFSGAKLFFKPDELMVLRHGFAADVVQRLAYRHIVSVGEGEIRHPLVMAAGFLLVAVGVYALVAANAAGFALIVAGMLAFCCGLVLGRQTITVSMDGWRVRLRPVFMSAARRAEIVAALLARVAACQEKPPELLVEPVRVAVEGESREHL